jgi:hypothetical protein
MSRKSKLEPWMLDVVETAIMEGMPLRLVGGLIGVKPTTLNGWYQDGSQDDCPDALKVAFASRVDVCRAKAAREGIALMRIHALGDYRAALELLKVSDPETWNTAKKHEVTRETIVKRDLSGLDAEELLALQRIEEKIERKALGSG